MNFIGLISKEDQGIEKDYLESVMVGFKERFLENRDKVFGIDKKLSELINHSLIKELKHENGKDNKVYTVAIPSMTQYIKED